ncbi:DUF4012 domain-containing protein [Microbacterium sp. NPDC055903]
MSDGRLPVRRRWLGWVIGTLLVLLLLAIGWVVVRGIGAASALQQISHSATRVKAAIAEGDIDRARNAADSIATQASTARDLTGDPIWRGFEFTPWLGANFTAVREVAEIADSVAADALSPVLDAAEGLDLAGLGFTGTAIDLAPFAAVEAPLADASTVLADADAKARAIDADATIPALADAVRELRSVVSEATGVVGALHGASVLLPSMLGTDGPRSYVVAMQNNAELRSSGGIVGALALVTADKGQIRIVRNASTRDFPPLAEPLEMSETTVALFDDQPGTHIQNLTSVIEFPEAAQAISTRWTDRFGGTIDGVIAVDAVVAEHLVAATGDIAFGPFTVNADDILDVLLSEIYSALPDPAQQDAVFANASGALLAAAMRGAEPQALLGALVDSADEGRVRIWSAHEPEQEILARSTLGGTLAQDDDDATWVGVLVNDTTGGKMDFYADATISTAVGVCSGEPTTQVTVTWTNGAPADAASSLPGYVTGDGAYDVPPGSTRTLIAVYGPQGALPSHIDRDGSEEPVQTATVDDRTVIQHSVELAPGESTTITVRFTGEGAGERLTETAITPMVRAPETTRAELRCGS